jgi:hypothetical protein
VREWEENATGYQFSLSSKMLVGALLRDARKQWQWHVIFTGGMLLRYAHIALRSASFTSFKLNHGIGGRISRPLGCP